MERLVEFKPSFITCTYGAGGSTQELTLDIVARVNREFKLPRDAIVMRGCPQEPIALGVRLNASGGKKRC